MKISTSIPPNAKGLVKVTAGAETAVFSRDDETGELVADIESPDLAKFVLGCGENFWPTNPDDNEAAMALLNGGIDAYDLGDDGSDDSSDDLGDDLGDDGADAIDPNAAPIEANTPPKTITKKGGRKAGAR